MNFIVGLLSAAKGFVFLSGLFGAGKSHVAVMPPQLTVTATEIRTTCAFSNAYPAELKDLARTGTEIIMYLFVETREIPGDGMVGKAVFESRLAYDPITATFVVKKSTSGQRTFSLLDSAIAESSLFREVTVISLDRIKREESYYLVFSGVLGKTKVEALDNTIDLMYFWDYKRPVATTERYTGAALLVRKDRLQGNSPAPDAR